MTDDLERALHQLAGDERVRRRADELAARARARLDELADDAPAAGYPRPPVDLTAADPITEWCAEERARIRAEFAAAAAKARRWEPGR